MTTQMHEPVEPLVAAVARRLRGVLAEERMSQRDLAEVTGLTQSTLSRRLSGERPLDLDEIEKICRAVNISPEWLLTGGVGGPTPPGPAWRARRYSKPQPSDPKVGVLRSVSPIRANPGRAAHAA